MSVKSSTGEIRRKGVNARRGEGVRGYGRPLTKEVLPKGSPSQKRLMGLTVRFFEGRVAELDDREAANLVREVEQARSEGARLGILLAGLGSPASPAKVTADLPAANRAALERAMARAGQRKSEILKRPEMLTGEAAAKQLGVSRQTIHARTRAGQLLALEFGKRGLRYPAWQFDEVIVGDALAGVLHALDRWGPWAAYRFFTQVAPALEGRTPVEALRAGEADRVLRLARTWSEGEQGGG